MGRTTQSGGTPFAISPTTVAQDDYTWMGFPLDPPALGDYPGGGPRTSRNIAVTSISGSLGISFRSDGTEEIILAAGSSVEGHFACQGVLVRGASGSCQYQLIAELE